MDNTEIARVAHEVNRAVQFLTGEEISPHWDEAPRYQRDSAITGVNLHKLNTLTPEESHAAWLAHKEAEGWSWGPEKNEETKQHPCFVMYDELPELQRLKDVLFKAVVDTLK